MIENDNNKPLFLFEAPLFIRSGYSDWGMCLAKSFIKSDRFNMVFVPTKWGGCSRRELNESDPMEVEVYKRILRQQLTKQPEIYGKCSIPSEMNPIGKYNINFTAGIETTIAPPVFVEGLNRANLNIVTSEHSKNVFQNAVYSGKNPQGQEIKLKLEKPIETLFWGIDTSIFGNDKPSEQKIDDEFLENITEDFCFLFVGQWTSGGLFSDRKDIGNLIKTFMLTFSNMGNKPKPALIIKTSGASICNVDKHDIINRLKAIKSIVENEIHTKDLPKVYLLYGNLNEKEMNALYNHPKVKSHISFTHGEGFGAPLLEASLSGKPVLAPNWSGHIDFLDSRYCKLLDGEMVKLPSECVNQWLISESKWWNVDNKKAGESMKNCFHHYGTFLEKAEELRKINVEKFSIESMEKQLSVILDKYIPKFSVQQKIVLPKLKKIKPIAETVENNVK